MQNVIDLRYCPIDEQLADMLTKPLSNNKFEKFKDKPVKIQNK